MTNMIILAMSFGPPIEVIIGFILLLIIIIGFIGLIITRFLTKSSSIRKMLEITFLIPVVLVIIGLLSYSVYKFTTSPMTVKKYHLKGTFVINREMFKGKNADWQYDHYWINIKNDTLFLHIMSNGKEIKMYKRQIAYIDPYHRMQSRRDHVFFGFVNTDKEFQNQHANNEEQRIFIESEEHHMLINDPRLLASPFSFNIVLVSNRYGNMFFTRGKWKVREK